MSSTRSAGFAPAGDVDDACCVAVSGLPAFAASCRVPTLCFSVCANGTAAGLVAASLPADVAAADEPAPRAALMAVPAVSSSAPSRGRGGMAILSFESGERLRRAGRIGPHAQNLRGVFVGVALFALRGTLRFLRDAARLQGFV
ncbi:Secreted protein [Burkholderia ambifaria]